MPASSLALLFLSLTLAASFFSTGAGGTNPDLLLAPSFAKSLGALAGSPLLFCASLCAALSGIWLATDSYVSRFNSAIRTSSDPSTSPVSFPNTEFFLFSVASLASFYLLLTILGVAHRYQTRTLAVLFTAAVLHNVLAVAAAMSLSRTTRVAPRLYIFGLLQTVLSLATLSAIGVFMGGAGA